MSDILVKGHQDYDEHLHRRLKNKGIHYVIGFSGGADSSLHGIDEDDELQDKYQQYQKALHQRIIKDTLEPLRKYPVAVLTGGTTWGVPNTANAIAKSLGFTTIGVTPRAGLHHALPKSEVDIQITVDPMFGEAFWGDEGPVWTGLVDAIVVIGGGAGTLTECAHIMKINEALVKTCKQPKYMIPIHGTGGLADQLQHLWAKPKIRNVSMPKEQVYTGAQASKILLNTLDLEYHY